MAIRSRGKHLKIDRLVGSLMASEQENKGVTATEHLLYNLCLKSFLRLWSYANPFKDDGNEFCDVIAVFDRHVFIFFDRYKYLPDLTEVDNPRVSWDRWKRRAIESQIKTAHGAERYLLSGRKLFLDAKKEKLFPVTFDISDAIIHKIVVAHGAAEACRKFSENNISGSLAISYSDKNIDVPFPFTINLEKSRPVHILDSNTLPIILGELDTVKDFANYLDAKIMAINKYEDLLYCGEEDLLANYWLNIDDQNKHFIGTYDEKINSFMVAEGAWESLKKRPEYKATKEANQQSYFWDDLINRTCENFLKGVLLGNSDLLEGRSAIREMAKEPRFIRRSIVELMFGAILNFPNNPTELMRHMRFIPSHEKGKGYVFLQIFVPPGFRNNNYGIDERTVRQEILLIACGAAKNHMPDLHTIIGIGIEPPKISTAIGEDFILLDCTDWSREREMEFREKNKGFNFFSTHTLRRHEGKTTEFVKPSRRRARTHRISKVGRNDPCPCGSGIKFKKCHGIHSD
ncbi:YecA family protein [Methylobacterium oryzihabitans]|uniref:Preprotein translocase subunit SecA n=1 Tax=Methylobacterium oryzihabitans TaxID=2499852 RepID=A0A437P5F9_9HYPH|nr:SEC-C domain-containing protein [Methylobacterium oryzihabitans]RVU17506.1 hypothetical protein EOE48_14050 [Methylobacterium oryzihabitans]